jgi:hypothetical protein
MKNMVCVPICMAKIGEVYLVSTFRDVLPVFYISCLIIVSTSYALTVVYGMVALPILPPSFTNRGSTGQTKLN